MLTTLRNLSCHLDPGISSLAQLDPEQVTYTIYSIYSASCSVTTGTDSHLCNAMQTSASGLDISTFNVNNNALKFTNQAATSARNHHNVKTYYFPKIHYQLVVLLVAGPNLYLLNHTAGKSYYLLFSSIDISRSQQQNYLQNWIGWLLHYVLSLQPKRDLVSN